ncbi:hypothetical protein ACWIID_15025 [Streptomyces phaeochromogenes]
MTATLDFDLPRAARIDGGIRLPLSTEAALREAMVTPHHAFVLTNVMAK